jgi:uncharacterized protein YodC (DUF2158 family)
MMQDEELSGEIDVGALVRLVSGGPAMVVIHRDDSSIICLYYAAEAEEFKKLEVPIRAVALLRPQDSNVAQIGLAQRWEPHGGI